MTENSTLVADYRQMSNNELAIAGVGIAVFSMILEFIVIFNPLSGFSSTVSGDENVRRRSLPNRRMNRGDENYEISKSVKRERKRIKESSNSKKSRRIQASSI
jgi:hypothetical protein